MLVLKLTKLIQTLLMNNDTIKIAYIGDVHGKSIWKKFIKDPTINVFVFVGDYVDEDMGMVISDEEMIENLQDVIDFKRKNMNSVVLLKGNHDGTYINLNDPMFKCSRFRESIGMELHDLFSFNKDLFQNAFQYKNVIATHAGIQHNWFINDFKGDVTLNIADQLNNPQDRDQEDALFQIGKIRGGWASVGGIFWADRSELKKPLKGVTQVVGHNRVKDISFYENKKYGNIYFIDCLGYKENILIMEL